MPVSYQLDRDLGLIRTRCKGEVSFEDVQGHFRELAELLPLPDPLHVLLDLTGAKNFPEGEQMKRVSDEILVLKQEVNWGAWAVVANNEVWFGLSRMFLSYAEDVYSAAFVFREPGEAERWLASQMKQGR